MFSKAFEYGERNKPSQKEMERRRFANKKWSDTQLKTKKEKQNYMATN